MLLILIVEKEFWNLKNSRTSGVFLKIPSEISLRISLEKLPLIVSVIHPWIALENPLYFWILLRVSLVLKILPGSHEFLYKFFLELVQVQVIIQIHVEILSEIPLEITPVFSTRSLFEHLRQIASEIAT